MDEKQKQNTVAGEPRRAVLQKCGAALTGLSATGIGVFKMSTSVRASSASDGITVSGGSGDKLSYIIKVTGSIQPGSSNLESDDDDTGPWASGTIVSGRDSWEYTGMIQELHFDGAGDLSVYSGGRDSTSTYKVTLYSDVNNGVCNYIWSQDGLIEERGNTSDPNDKIERDSNGGYTAQGYVSTAEDNFLASGTPNYLYVDDNDQGFHWYAFNF